MMPPSRNAADPELARGLHGDLDHVILTALAPGVTSRYESVAALREDVRRVREGFPVLVRRSSPAERPVRLVRRNPWLSAAWGVAAVATLGVMANTIVQGRRVARERDLASAERDVAAVERDRANRERDRARATNRLLASLFERGDPFAPGRGDTLRVTQVLAEGVERVTGTWHSSAAPPSCSRRSGAPSMDSGSFRDAQSLLDTARRCRRTTPT
jgi:serine/threonine-protein kinase